MYIFAVFEWKSVQNFGDENLFEKFSAEMDLRKILQFLNLQLHTTPTL
jgi:hypothetical protein